jgi:hypothetical protein
MRIARRIQVALVVALVAAAAAPAALAAIPAPALPDLAAGSDSGASATDEITNDSTPTFTIDAGVAQAGMTVNVYAAGVSGGSTVGTAVVDGAGIATVTASTMTDGQYDVTAQTTDGVETSPSSPALVVVIDTTPPDLDVEPSLVDYVGSTPYYTPYTDPRFDVAAPTGSVVTLWEGPTNLGSDVSVGGNARIQVTTPLLDGWHTIEATAVDLAGNGSVPSPSETIIVDTGGPSSTAPDLLAADDNGASSVDNVTSVQRPRFDVTTEAGARVYLYENGLALGSTLADGGGSATVTVNPVQWLEPGTHCLHVRSMDWLMNLGPASGTLCVTITTGVPPFTANLGVALGPDDLALRVRSSLAGRATVRVFRNARVVAVARRPVVAGTTRMRVRLPLEARRARRLLVVTRIVAADGRALVFRRLVTR